MTAAWVIAGEQVSKIITDEKTGKLYPEPIAADTDQGVSDLLRVIDIVHAVDGVERQTL